MLRSGTVRPRRVTRGFELNRLPSSIRVFLLILLGVGVLLAFRAAASSSKSGAEAAAKAPVTIHAANHGKPYLNFQDGKRMLVSYRGDESLSQALQSGRAQSRALAAADLDRNATPDLITGYAYNGMGIITVQHGNPDAFAPKDDSVYPRLQKGYRPASLLPEAEVYSVPEPVDFLVIGDFTGEGKKDVLTAARGGGLYLFRSNSEGKLDAPESILVSGAITALAAGNFGLTNGVTSVLVGVLGTDGAEVLAYEGGFGGLQAAPQVYAVSAEVSSLSLGRLDDDQFGDAAVVAGNDLEIIHGGGNVNPKTAQSRIERIDTGVNVRQVSIGDFVPDRNGWQEIALLSDDGGIHVIQRSDLDVRPYTAEEQAFRMSHRIVLPEESKESESIKWNPDATATWKAAQRFESDMSATRFSSQARISTAHVTPYESEDLFVVDAASNQVKIIGETAAQQDAALSNFMAPRQRATMSLDDSSTPVAMIALPGKLNGARDLVVLNSNQSAPSSVEILPLATIDVDRTDDPAVTVSGVGAAACTGAANDCSLRGATLFANANAGTAINIPAGTYSLTIGGDTAPAENGLCTDATKGDLDLTPNTTLTGAGAATTIIRQTTTTDRIICLDAPVSGNKTYTLSGITFVGGREIHGVGGGGIVSGAIGDVTNLTNVVVVNNQVNGTGSPNFGSPVGGGFGQANGTLNVSGSTFGGSTTVAGCPNQADTTCGNSATGSGGGIYQQGSDPPAIPFSVTTSTFQNNTTGNGGGAINLAATGTASYSSISITGSTFQGNTATSSTSRGGAIRNESVGAATTMNISTCTFLSNSVTGASANGGAVASADGANHNVSISFSRLVSNTAPANTGGGQAIYGGTSSTMTINNDWWGINTGPDTVCGAGNPCDAAGTFTVTTWLQLRNIPSLNPIKRNQSTTLTADIYGRNSGGPVANCPGGSCALNGLASFPTPAAVIFSNAVLGVLSNNPAQQFVNGDPTATYTAGNTPGTGHADATADNQTTTANIDIVFPPTISKAFGAQNIPVGGSTSMTFTINNPNTNPFATIALSGITFTDTLPANLVIATPNGLSGVCGGSVTATAGSNSVSLTGGTLAGGAMCTISVNVTSAVDGVYNNTTGVISATESDAGVTSNTATLTVINPPHIVKAFGAATIPLNGTTSLTFTLDSNSNQNLTLSGVAFTDSLPAGLVVATPNNLSNTCGGVATAVAGSSSVSLSGASIAPVTSCTLSVNITGTTAGVKNNSVTPTATNGGGVTGNTSNASITVVAPPTISKAFNPTSIALNASSTLSFTITNPNTASPLSGVAFTDNLPAGVVVAATPNVTGSCGSGTITAVAGSGTISLSGGTLTASPAVGSSCTFSADVTGTTAGSKSNTTGAVTSTEGGTGTTSNTAVLTVVASPTIAKVFNPNKIVTSGTTSLQFTITNPAANTVALTGVAFTDTLPTGLTVISATTAVCGGTLTTTAPTVITLSGATIATNSNCQFSVTVTGASQGGYTNTTGNVSSTNGGTGGNASADLLVLSPTATNGDVSGRILDDGGLPVAGATVSLSGTQNRSTITDANGNYRFDGVETSGLYTVTPTRANYTFTPTQRSFSQLGQHTDAAFTAALSGGIIINPIDTVGFFVRQQYVDLLGREPDEPGFTAWVNGINTCVSTATCDRIHVSEMFFRSNEFQDRGYYIYRFYSTAIGRKPDYVEFTPDMARVSGFLTVDQLEAAKMQYAIDFANRPSFVSKYGALSNAAYVDALLTTAQVSLQNRQTLIDALNNGAIDRAHALRIVAESNEVYQKYYNQAFVVMEYFGYLHRDPDALYLNWIDVLNQTGDARHMVEGFVNSIEYRGRFSR